MSMTTTYIKVIILVFLAFLVFSQTFAQPYVDKDGLWRWNNSNEQISLFGVNYTVPFAHSYRAHKQLGIDPKESINRDVYHFARLGLDAYRIHVWNCKISDSMGNLIENEHLDLFDYLLAKLKERNIKIVITPMLHGGNGYPDPGEKLNSFALHYSKEDIFTNKNAIKAQKRYLEQFLNHNIKLSDLKKSEVALLPRPYPSYIAYWKTIGNKDDSFDINEIESVQISFGNNVKEMDLNKKLGITVEKIILQ